MLTEEEKNKITLEEIYRHEIRKNLDKIKTSRNNVALNFFNSNLGIFILSSCVLSLITWGFTKYSNHLQITAENNSQIKKMEYEIGYRLEVINKMQDTCFYDNFINIKYAIRGRQENPSPNTKIIVFEVFDNRSLFSLMYEHNILLDKIIETEIISALKELQPIFQVFQRNVIEDKIWAKRKYYLPKDEKTRLFKIMEQLRKWQN